MIYYIILHLSFLLASTPEYLVNVDRKNISINESVRLTLTIYDFNEDPKIKKTDFFSDWKILSGPTTSSSSNISWINGKMEKSSTNTIEWILSPLRSGKLTIPSIDIIFKDLTIKSKPISVNVNKKRNNKSEKSSKFFIVASVDEQKPYRGQQIILTYTLYTKVDISSIDETLPVFKGFWVEELFTPSGDIKLKEVRKYDQLYYSAVIKKIALFPTKSGKINISPLIATIGVQSNRRENIFSVFGTPLEKHSISSNLLEINVIPLPDSKSDISAVIGDWSIDVSVRKDKFIQDKAFSIEIVLSGEGNLKTVDIPPIKFPSSLETFDPEITINRNKKNYNAISGNKIIEYVAIPRESGKLTLPSIKLLFFDINKNQWITKSSKKIILDIKKNDKIVIDNYGLSKREVQLIGKDIKFIDETKPKWNRIDGRVIGIFEYILLLLIIASFSFPLAITKINQYGNRFKHIKEAYNPSIKYLDNVEDEIIYKSINKAIFSFINIKCNYNKAEYSISDVLTLFSKHALNKKDVNQIKIIMEKGNLQRFSKQGYKIKKDDVDKIKDLLKKADESWK